MPSKPTKQTIQGKEFLAELEEPENVTMQEEEEEGDMSDGEVPSGAEGDEDMGREGAEGDEGEDDDEDEEAKLKEAVTISEAKVLEEPESYDAHAAFVTALRNACMFDELRVARKTMQAKFPLPPEVWLQWLEDEKRMASNKAEKKKILDLCALAIQDYLSPPIWMIYLTLACEICFEDEKADEKEVPTARAIFTQAAEELGGHLTHGTGVWSMYIAFENTLAAFKKTPNTNESREVVRKLWKAQFEHPLIGADDTLQEYKEWEKEIDSNFSLDSETGQNYKRANADLTLRVPFEEKVAEARSQKTTGPGEGSPALSAAWAAYLEFEMNASKKKHAVRVKSLFERALTDLFLSLDLWLQYLAFLQQYFRKAELLSSVYTRASRNCPWSGRLWGGFIQSLITHGDNAQAEVVFERAMGTSLASAGDFIDLCLVMALHYRERAGVGEVFKQSANFNDNPEVGKLRAVLGRAGEYLSYLPEDDPFDYHYSVLGLWATLEAVCLGEVVKAREVWEMLVESRRGDWRAWLDFAAMERVYGSIDSCRAVFKRATTEVLSPLYAQLELARAWLKFERQSGDFDHVEKAHRRTEKLTQQVQAATAMVNQLEEKAAKGKKPPKEGKEKGGKQNKEETKKDKRPRREEEGERAKSGPRSSSNSGSSSSGIRGSTGKAVSRGEDNKPQKRERDKDEEGEKEKKDEGFAIPSLPVKRQKFAQDDEGQDEPDFNRLKNDKSGRTVFVLNLAWGVTEEELSKALESVGTIKEALHVRDAKGNSKGFGYVQYESKESADAAILKLDGVELQGRKLTINPSQSKPPITDEGREKRTVYVKGIPRVQNVKELLMQKFATCGAVAEVRVAKDHDGNLKKFAFVEFTDETSIDAALKLDGSLLISKEEEAASREGENEKKHTESAAVVIQVIKSKAPTQKEKNQKIKSAKRSEDVEPTRAKVNHKLQLLPRALQQKGRPLQAPIRVPPKQLQTVAETENEDGTEESSTPMSNADFKALLSKR